MAKNEFICGYGDCHVLIRPGDYRIGVYDDDERPRFCSRLHALLWLLRRTSGNAFGTPLSVQLEWLQEVAVKEEADVKAKARL